MTIKKTFFLTSIHTAIKIMAGIIMNKIIAIYLGPSGLALIGQFQNFTSLVSGIGNASIQTGIVKITAENESPEERKTVWGNALVLSVSFSILTSLLIFVFANYIAKEVLFDVKYTFLIQVFSLSIVFYSLNLHVLSILNGIGNIRLYSLINILISVMTLILVLVLAISFNLNGALYALIFTQSVVFFLTYISIYKDYKNDFFHFSVLNLDLAIIKQLLKYGLTSFISGFIFSIMMLTIRYIIINKTSLENAGLWEATIKIGLYFNMLFIVPVSIYFLPKFSAAKNSDSIKKLFYGCFCFILPIMIILAIIIYFLRDFVIGLLFSQDFSSINNLLLFLLFGEILRVSAGVFNTFFLANKSFIVSVRNEFFWALTFGISCYLMIDYYGLLGVVYSYFAACCIFLFLNITTFLILYADIKRNKPKLS